jgi:hypothetical protein
MGSANRKALLFLDKCPDTTILKPQLKNIKEIFFPAHCTSRLQPLDPCDKGKISDNTYSKGNCCHTDKDKTETLCTASNAHVTSSLLHCCRV